MKQLLGTHDVCVVQVHDRIHALYITTDYSKHDNSLLIMYMYVQCMLCNLDDVTELGGTSSHSQVKPTRISTLESSHSVAFTPSHWQSVCHSLAVSVPLSRAIVPTSHTIKGL